MKTALRSDDPVLFLEHKGVLNLKGPVPDGEHLVPLGKAAIAREGTHATVVGVAFMVKKALEAADELSKEGINIEVIDPRSLAPLDIDTVLASVKKTGRLLVVDEDFAPCGAAAEIAMQVMEKGFDDLDAPVARLTGLSCPAPYSPALFQDMVPETRTVVKAVRDLLAE